MSGVTGATGSPIQIDPEALHAGMPAKKIKEESGENSVSHSDAKPGHGGCGDPLEGARNATPKKLTDEDLDRMTDERLMRDPDYRELKELLDKCDGLEAMFYLIDTHVGTRNNDTICLDDILALVGDVKQPNKAVRDAGVWLNDHREVWSAIAKGDALVGLHDVKEFIAGLKAQLKEMKTTARAKVDAENVPAPPATTPQPGAAGAQSGAGGTGTPAPAGPSVESLVPRPPPSSLPGMDGATENLSITADYLQAQMMALAQEASDKPEKATLNAQKIAMLQNKFQAVTNMMNQLTQMLSNMSKMWSDVAMNSIRNLK